MNQAEKVERERLEDEIARGRRIDQLLADETVKAVFQGLEISYFQAWKDAGNPTKREEIYSRVSAFDDLRGTLRNIVTSGERATHELAALERDTDQI